MELQKRDENDEQKNLTMGYHAIAKEWDYTRNRGLKSDDFACGSQIKVKWKCEKGHCWGQTIISMTRGRGCPYCNARKVSSGANDLLTIAPELAFE
jgi:hypothetical protein